MADFRDEVRQRFATTRQDRTETRDLVADGRLALAEPVAARLDAYADRRRRRLARRGPESYTGAVLEALSASFLSEGAALRRAVAYLEVNVPRHSSVGSGFLVSPRLLLTNAHVIPDAATARSTQVIFDKETDERGTPRATTTFLLDPDACFLASPPEALDYALVALGARSSGVATPEELGFCVLSDRGDKHVLGMGLNIIQHPRGAPKMAALRKNLLTARTARTLLYETDTDHGSSGSPVFNDDWDLVALHHWGEPFLEKVDESGRPIRTNLNEGVRISAIVQDLAARLPALPALAATLLDEALSLHAAAVPASGAARLSPPRLAAAHPPGVGAGAVVTVAGGAAPTATAAEGGHVLQLSVPLEITIRLGAPGQGLGSVLASPALAARALTTAAEALRRDVDYANRTGYDPAFLPGAPLPLPALSAPLRRALAPLREGEPQAAGGELRYVHFSLKLHRTRRMAIYSATNIDGESYLDVTRATGSVADSAEGDTWFIDPRISSSFVLGQPFYSEWAHLFDRGHLTRRNDPTWGTAEDAERANADTFHFTNCAPQHFRFNQSARFWQGAERYVLEKGVLAQGVPRRLTVFQGPIFDASIDLWAGEAQIPSAFFKLVVWRGMTALKAVGLIVDQKLLLGEQRGVPGTRAPVPGGAVPQWRVGVRVIEKRTGLNFGRLVRAADTILAAGAPAAGAEAQIAVRAFADLLPEAEAP